MTMFDPKMGYCVEFGQMLWLLVGSPKNGRTGAQNPEIGRVADSQKYTSPIFGHFGSNGVTVVQGSHILGALWPCHIEMGHG